MSIKGADRLKHILVKTEYLIDVLKEVNNKEKLETNKNFCKLPIFFSSS